MKKIIAFGAASLFLMSAATGHAETGGEGPRLIKGQKSYQNVGADRKENAAPAEQTAAATNPASAQDASQVEPAAGATDETGAQESKAQPLHEQMRLPRKGF